jgi:antitoxin component YwqK of YwqJK toxin-antitoxin module
MQNLKIHKLLLTAATICLFLMKGYSQTFKLSENGDTLNLVDAKKQKQGKWVNTIPEQRGNEGYEEEGIYKNDKKEGYWRLYNLQGDLIGVEQYKLGGKHGLQQYYTYLGNLVKEENWKGYDPETPYDTIPVYGSGNNEIVDFKIVKAEQYSVKHGEWRWYAADGSGRLVKTEKYDRGLLEKDPNAVEVVKTKPATDKKKEIPKTAQMLEWEKKNKGKKNVIRDGRTYQ